MSSLVIRKEKGFTPIQGQKSFAREILEDGRESGAENEKIRLAKLVLHRKGMALDMKRSFRQKQQKTGADAAQENYWAGKIKAFEEVLEELGFYS